MYDANFVKSNFNSSLPVISLQTFQNNYVQGLTAGKSVVRKKKNAVNSYYY